MKTFSKRLTTNYLQLIIAPLFSQSEIIHLDNKRGPAPVDIP